MFLRFSYILAAFSQVLVTACENKVDILDQHVSNSKDTNCGGKASIKIR
jgi:hypothetical protein